MNQEIDRTPPIKLPGKYLFGTLFFTFSQLALLLLYQPAAYWINPKVASSYLPLHFLMKIGPLFFSCIAVAYLLLMGILLYKLPAHLSYPLASGMIFFHSTLLFLTLVIRQTPFEPANELLGSVLFYVSNIVVFGLLFSILIGFRQKKWIRWMEWASIPVMVVWVFLLGFGLYRTIHLEKSLWQPIVPEHTPGYRTMAAIAYDKNRQRAVMFGGVTGYNTFDMNYAADTWEWDGSDWQKIETEIAPPARFDHAMAFDENRGTVLLYGGRNWKEDFSDLWEWDGRTWTELCPVCNPADRFSHGMFFDIEREQIVIYGGMNFDKGYNEAWTWDGESWCQYPFYSNTPGLFYSPLVYDQRNHRAVSLLSSPDWAGTWIWQDYDWKKMDIDLEPSVRIRSSMVYNPQNGQMILFGGENTIDEKPLYTNWLNDTWLFDGENWSELESVLSPPARFGSMAFYDEVRQTVIIYGGQRVSSLYDDMWELVLPGGN